MLSTISVAWCPDDVSWESMMSPIPCFKQSSLKGNDGLLVDPVKRCYAVGEHKLDGDDWAPLLGNLRWLTDGDLELEPDDSIGFLLVALGR